MTPDREFRWASRKTLFLKAGRLAGNPGWTTTRRSKATSDQLPAVTRPLQVPTADHAQATDELYVMTFLNQLTRNLGTAGC